jgi:hypothetical protein
MINVLSSAPQMFKDFCDNLNKSNKPLTERELATLKARVEYLANETIEELFSKEIKQNKEEVEPTKKVEETSKKSNKTKKSK